MLTKYQITYVHDNTGVLRGAWVKDRSLDVDDLEFHEI